MIINYTDELDVLGNNIVEIILDDGNCLKYGNLFEAYQSVLKNSNYNSIIMEKDNGKIITVNQKEFIHKLQKQQIFNQTVNYGRY